MTFLPLELPFVSTIGGVPGDVYAAGTTYSSSISYAWMARLTFDAGGKASMREPTVLPAIPGYTQEYGEGVTVDATGHPRVVGEVVSDGDTSVVRAVEWATGAPVFLDSLPGLSGWKIESAAGINQSGEIAAEGTRSSGEQAVLIVPKPTVR
jgi:hypothetical protein